MRAFLRLPPLELAVYATLVIAILAFVSGSSSIVELAEIGRKARWGALLVLFVVSLAYAASIRDRRRPERGVYAVAAALGVLALLSSAWSVDPRATVARASSFLVALATVGLLALAATRRPAAIPRLLAAIVVAAVAAAVAGLILFFVDPSLAHVGGRLRGLGQNPNTVPMLAAVAFPLALYFLFDARTPASRGAATAAVGVLYATIVVSASRGALVAAFAAAFPLVVLLGRSAVGRTAWATAVVALFAGSFVYGELQHPPPPPPSTAPPLSVEPLPDGGGTTPPDGTDGNGGRGEPSPPGAGARRIVGAAPPLDDEIGHPAYMTGLAPDNLRTGSGRTYAWRGAIETAGERPLLGHGFGTENRVFVDRYYFFVGAYVENSFLGLSLQLGLVGLLLFVTIGGLTLWTVIGAARDSPTAPSRLVMAAAAAAGVGFVIALFQSFAYSVGNVATVPFWLAVFLVPAAAAVARAHG